ncbi:SAM-dependent methyltransferase [Archangium lansingense]|uniref:Methyltransferase domain-containing protein n=1 Tax=Archangium lansingense TaxID=2995310 RepID=A0ABT4ALT3_9BACT|nr:methyltransferase domain-containing protein [Archangium lansinium]MCY1082665.1 methyltransferase domain-containing protein [Archangium lansinium]
MSTEIEATPESVARHYDSVTPFYEIIGSRSLHFGYWPQGDAGGSFGEAQQRFTDLLLGQLGSQAGQRVIDVGCGLGEPAIQLARSTGCKVEGITISPLQAAQAGRWANQLGMGGQTTFHRGDAMALPFPAESFDAAWAIESLFHMPDRAAVLRELARVLRPGGRMLIADIVLSADATPEDRSFLQRAFVARSFSTTEAYPALVRDAGFELEQLLDVRENVLPTFGAVASALREKEAEVRQAYSEDFLAGVQGQWARITEHALRCMGYIVLTAKRRPLEE